MDRQTVTDPETDRQTECPPPPNEWALRRTPGPRRRGHGGPAQGNREYVGGHMIDRTMQISESSKNEEHPCKLIAAAAASKTTTQT